jgi:predicted nucleotidyltransferase
VNVKKIKEVAAPILRRHGVAKAFVFGSYARGEENEKSDVDLLIEYPSGSRKTLFDLAGLKDELEEALQKKVDLVTEKALSPFIKSAVLKEKQVIL